MAENTGFSDCWTYPKEVIDEKLGDITNQYDSIQAAGEAAIAAVAEEGTTQVGLVTAKGQEVIQSIPADYSELSADVSGLKSDLIQTVTFPEWEVGSYNYPNGANYSSTTRIRLVRFVGKNSGVQKITALTGYEFSVFAWDISTGNYVGALMSTNTFATSGTLKWISNFNCYQYPNYKFKVALRNAVSPTATIAVSAYTNCVFTENAVIELTERVDSVESDFQSTVTTFYGKNLYDPSKDLVNKYLNPTGVLEDYNNRYVTDYLPVEEGKYVTISYVDASYAVTRTGYQAICCYTADKSVIAGGNYNGTTFLVPQGVAYVRVTVGGNIHGTTNNGTMIELTDNGQPTAYVPFCGYDRHLSDDVIVPEQKLGYMRITGNLADAQSLTLPYHNVKNSNVLLFTGKITTFDKLKIGKETTDYIIVDDTNVEWHTGTYTFTYAHGLTIANDIQVFIENQSSITQGIIIRVISSGVAYEITDEHNFYMDDGSAYVTSDGSVLTDCVFTWTSRNINKPIWYFGDSYLSFYPSRWTYYLVADGFIDSCILNGYAGESAVDGLAALKNLLKVRVPEYVVWGLGMNNSDSASAVSPSWYTCYIELIELSKYYGFTIILQTIPNTPTQKNNYKNEIIRESGYRVIDFDEAIVIDSSGNWIPGTREENGVHPTIAGAKILYQRLLCDFPEITTR